MNKDFKQDFSLEQAICCFIYDKLLPYWLSVKSILCKPHLLEIAKEFTIAGSRFELSIYYGFICLFVHADVCQSKIGTFHRPKKRAERYNFIDNFYILDSFKYSPHVVYKILLLWLHHHHHELYMKTLFMKKSSHSTRFPKLVSSQYEATQKRWNMFECHSVSANIFQCREW